MKFTEEQRKKMHDAIALFVRNKWINADNLIGNIEYILTQSAQITPEPGESGQSAEDVLDQHYKGYLKRIAFPEQVLAAMTTYASQVCADKDAKIKFWIDGWNHLSRMYDQSQSELDRLNESLTVMLRNNAELENELEYSKIR